VDLLRPALSAFVAAAALAACRPDLDQRASRITSTRVLAVRAEPAEVEPSDGVTLTALVVDAQGALVSVPPASWAFCSSRKPLAELGPVSPACYGEGAGSLVSLGVGDGVKGTMPASACRDFGPEVPQPKPGEPFGRPVDPDPTGGYYQPVTLQVGAAVSVDQARVACGVAGAPSEDVVTFRQRYHANENPAVGALIVDGAPVSDDASAAPPSVHRGARVKVEIEWPPCPDVDACGDGVCGPDESGEACADDCGKPKGCTGAERYLWFDSDARALVVRREEMRVSWFSSAGLFDRDRTGRGEEDVARSSENDWTAPDAPGSVRLWVVLRDSRGGVAWRSFVLDVE
jgi:hypothetical protein